MLKYKITASFNKADELPVEVMIYQDIGDDPFSDAEGFTARNFSEAIKDVPKNRTLDFRINSAGGSVWDGLAIKTLIDEWPGKKTASIDGIAASAASWLCCNKDIEVRAPRHAQMFIHPAWGLCMGDAVEMRKQADDLEKTTEQIAGIYSAKTGRSPAEWLALMAANSLLTAEEANKLGLIDRLTDDAPVGNFSALQIRNMKSKLAMLNSLKTATSGQPKKQNETNMNRKQKIALLNKWGVSVSKNATDSFIDKMMNGILSQLPQNAAKFKNGKDGDHADDCDCASCNAAKGPGPENAPEPSAETPGADHKGAPAAESAEFKAATANMKNFLTRQRNKAIHEQFDKFVTAGRLGANEVKDWMPMAIAAEDTADGANPIINQLDKTLPQQVNIGVDPLHVELGESDSVIDLDKAVTNLLKPAQFFSRNGSAAETLHDRMVIGENSKRVSQLINRFKKYDTKKNQDGICEMVGPLRAAWDKFVSSPRNANSMAAGLLRQVILSEVMRAFRRQFTSLTYFAHNFGNIPLEGTDVVQVPYYPLSTTASTEFTYANGYVVAANAKTQSKTITVGGVGDGTASAGSGRKYQTLQFTAYEIRRQPWLDIQKLSVMAGEQLAIDVRADIIGTQINSTNFGNAIWTGAAGGFDHTVLGNVLMLAATNAYWPKKGRNVVVAPQYHSNLAIDPGLYPYLYSGNTDILNEGLIQNKYTFENILEDALLPVANFIRGGDGTVTAGTDPNLAGYMCWPSAILIATAPIMPPPGVLKKLVAYEQITDDQTNLAFTYQFYGDEAKNRDNEIIECTYGSGLGELKALFRITSQGN